MTITPEARAEELAGILWEDECGGVFGKPGSYQSVTDRIASAIRAAENDVLERAAARIDEEDGYRIATLSLGADIRALKHKD